MVSGKVILESTVVAALVGAQQTLRDPGVAGPDIELMHEYFDEWPTGKYSCLSVFITFLFHLSSRISL